MKLQALQKSHSLLLLIIISLILIVQVESKYEFQSYPLANQYFDLVYEMKSKEITNKLFLHVSCKEINLLSISISTHLQFDEAPRFPIHSRTIHAPKFQQDVYTFLSGCHSEFKINTTPESIIKVVRKDNNQTIFQLKDLKISEGHNTFTIVDDSLKWGLGQRFQQKFKITEGYWSIWNRDKPWVIDRGTQGRSQQTYGHQPLYLARETKGNNFHISYFKNTHGMLIKSEQSSNTLKYNSVGGNIQFLLFLGGKNPQTLLQKYHNFIGKIHIPPFWSLGWHQCRWGYQNLSVFQDIVKKYEQNDLPIDTMWTDLDYMDKKQIFTISQSSYPSTKFNDFLKQKSLHYIPLIDVGVSIHDQTSIVQGTQMDVFIRDNHSSGYYIGQVWPGKVYFVDYLHPNASKFWQNQLGRLYQKIKFSGIWLDMNQPSNFKGNQPVHQTYKIQQGQSINMMTIDVNLKHYNNYNKNLQLYHNEVHAYFGHLSTVPTYEFLSKHGRPFIISRSNSVGTGAYAGHWTGDNNAEWPFLRLSISGNFLFQIFGIQMVGADICGFHLNTTQQLCSRWTQLGALYPFARNHNQDVGRSQQPFAFGKPLLKTAQYSIKLRYSILKQLYSILVDLKGKGSFFRPLFFQFFQDQRAYEDDTAETQFLLGKYFLSAPIVQQGRQERSVYFPKSGMNQKWYTLEYDPESPGLFLKSNTLKSSNKNKHFYEGGKAQNIRNQMPSGPVLFLRDGYMIFTNTPRQRSKLLDNQYFLTAALNDQNISSNRFLAIQNYQNEKILSQCINNSKCMMNVQIQKIGDINFKLTWKFQGQKQLFGRIQLKQIVVWKQDQQWTYSNAVILLQSVQGTKDLELKKSN